MMINTGSAAEDSLRERLFSEILPFVTKPGRYAGNELNSVMKADRGGMLKIALCFPEMYEIGMSYLGMQILYNMINKRPDCLAERAFAVWPDMEKRMREKDIPLFSIETSTPLREFDVLGFHLTYEMTYTTVLAMLDLARIPVYSTDRDDTDPLVLAGGPSVMNPEPMADFIDAFFIGEAEESISGIIESLKSAREDGLRRKDTLRKLSNIPGVYIPAFYEPEYDDKGAFRSLRKVESETPDMIRYVTVKELRTEYYPENPIVPFVETVHDHLPVEIMRGCVRGCRFCQAGYQYRPRRQRDPKEISNHVLSGISRTGYDDVTLLSLSSTDYDQLDDLLGMLSPTLNKRKIAMGLPSLRPETITPSLLNYLGGTRRTGLTIAPEAGTERMRNVLGKSITDDEIFRVAELASSEGYRSIKLYFMIGLPGETDEDIDGITAILRKVSYLTRKGRCDVNITISPFNPKSHTPWQWEKQESSESLKFKISRILGDVRKPNIRIKYPDLQLTMLEGAIGRGDRKMGRAIHSAFRKGSRLEGWSECFDPLIWNEALNEAGIDIDFYMRKLDENDPLPWDHIDKGISKEFLRKENENSRQGIPPKTLFDRKIEKPKAVSHDFGRRSKRVPPKSASIPGTYKLRLKYARGRDLKFLSHLDMIRTFYRAVRRSEIPVAFSEGYHPHLKISFGPPLPVGYTSDAEYLDLQLTQPFREDFIRSLGNSLPTGLSICGHRHYFAKTASLSKQLNLARYEISLTGISKIEPVALENIMVAQEFKVVRVKEEGEQVIEARRFIHNLRLDGELMIAEINQTPEGQIKPEEILIFGLGIANETAKGLDIHRLAQLHKLGERLIDPLELV